MIDVLKQALEALKKSDAFLFDWHENDSDVEADHYDTARALNASAITALRQAIKQAEPDRMHERGSKAWADVPDATAWLEDLRGNDDEQVEKQNRSDCGHQEYRAMCQCCMATKQEKKEAILQEISDIGQEAHTDHPARHWDRTCPACVAEEQEQPIAYKCPRCKDNLEVFLTAAPPRKEWVGLTDEEIWDVYKQVDSMQYMEFSRAIEAKLKEKNG